MNPHGLLPWYANKTLDSDEAALFESHLSGCEVCRDDLEALKKMQAELERYGETLLADHPNAEELVAVVRGEGGDDEIEPDKARRVREHLALCATCGDEARWATGAAAATGTLEVAPTGGWRLPAWGWATAAAVVLVALTVSLTTNLFTPDRDTGIVRVFLVEPTQRAPGAETDIRVPADTDLVRLLLEVDLTPGAFPAVFEVVDADRNTVHRNRAIAAADLYLGRFLFFECGRDDCPDGAYLARLIPRSGQGPATRYPFRLTTEPSGVDTP